MTGLGQKLHAACAAENTADIGDWENLTAADRAQFDRIAATFLNAARAEASPLSPVGWVMVPAEPSGAMVREGSDLFANRFGLKDDILVLPMAVQGAYRAMIAAAPVSGDTHD